jgi:hypothetical protein
VKYAEDFAREGNATIVNCSTGEDNPELFIDRQFSADCSRSIEIDGSGVRLDCREVQKFGISTISYSGGSGLETLSRY